MERLQGPINSSFFGEVNCLDQTFLDTESLRFEEDEQFLISSLEDNMPFLQMLQSVESPIYPLKEPNFQTLLRLQHMNKPWEEDIAFIPRMDSHQQVQTTLDFESCVTHDVLEMHSPVKSESYELQHKVSASCIQKLSYECNQEQTKTCSESQLVTTREKRKRKRTRPVKNKEDVENQRMTHIAVERNRRRQMNDHLSVLRSLMPSSYIQRGDQASIIGGAIDFVKELEQLLQSLEVQKRLKKSEEFGCSSSSSSPPASYGTKLSCCEENEVKAENKSEAADIKVTLIQTHVNLKIECKRRCGQLIKVIVALENLRLTILHLNITSFESSVLYSLNLKIEEDCKLGTANDIAEAVHEIFNYINGN